MTERLADLRAAIEAENISYGEIAELQSLAQYIDPSDVQLLEWAGVPEFPCGICGKRDLDGDLTPEMNWRGNHLACDPEGDK